MFSPKGGTGKTVTATNLAASFAKHEQKRTLLLDLDLQFGDAAIMLGLEPEKTIYDLVVAPGELDSEKLAGYTTKHTCGLDILPAPLRPEDAELVTEAKLARLLEVARESYDVIVVDTSPFFHGPMLATLDRTDELLLLCGLDVPTLKNVRLVAADARAALVPRVADPLRPQPRELEGRDEEERGRGRARRQDRLRGPVATAPCRSASTAGAPPALADTGSRLRHGDPRRSPKSLLAQRAAEEEAQVRRAGEGVGHGPPRPTLEAERKRGRRARPPSVRSRSAGPVAHPARSRPRPPRRASDPYAELKTRIHHAVIAKLGPELFKRETAEDLTERVLHAVTEQLALDRTPLTREERRQIVREITDDILGYGPLEPFLRDDSVTEVMVNGHDQIFVERDGPDRARRTRRSSTTPTCSGSSTRSSRRSAAAIDEASPMVDARLPDGSRVNAIIPPLALDGADADDPEVLARPVHDGRPDHLRLADAAGRAVPGRVRQGEAEHPHLRRYRHR